MSAAMIRLVPAGRVPGIAVRLAGGGWWRLWEKAPAGGTVRAAVATWTRSTC